MLCFDIIFDVYDYSDFVTRIILNKIMGLSYKTKNPLKNILNILNLIPYSDDDWTILDLQLYEIKLNLTHRKIVINQYGKKKILRYKLILENNWIMNKWLKWTNCFPRGYWEDWEEIQKT